MKIAQTQPPVGYRVGVSELVRSAVDVARSPGRRAALEADLARQFGVRSVTAVSSGKAALSLILRALHALTGRRKVIVPAYTCYSVPSAVVHAGLQVVPCDIAPGSFDYDYDRLQRLLGQDVLCVLSVHLFGIPSDTRRLDELCRPLGIFVVEDAAQALGGTSRGEPLGTLGDVGFFSLGRGKNITCGSGGLILTKAGAIASAVNKAAASIPSNGVQHDVRAVATLLLQSVFISPYAYWLPAGLPFLRLGETIFYDEFPVCRLSDFQAALLGDWRRRLAALNAVRRAHAVFYLSRIPDARSYGEVVPYLRFPLVLKSAEERQRLLAVGNGRALGISLMYPTAVNGIPQLQGRVPAADYPEAERVAATLVTLPTHPLLSKAARARICRLLGPVVAASVPLQKVRSLS